MFLIFRGFKDFQWTDARKRFVECFVPRYLIPYEDTFNFPPLLTPTLNPLAIRTSNLSAPPTMVLETMDSHTPPTMVLETINSFATRRMDLGTMDSHTPPTMILETINSFATPTMDLGTMVSHAPPTMDLETMDSHASPTMDLETMDSHAPPTMDLETMDSHAPPTMDLETMDSHAPPTMYLDAATSPNPKKRRTKKLNKDAATCFWKRVIDEANDNKEIGFNEFIEQVKDNMIKRKNQEFTKKEEVNVVKILIDRLLENRGSTKEFSHILSLTAQTGNIEAVIKLIRSKLSVVGLGYNLVPCIRLIKKSTAEIQTYFVSLCHPERTFSGFRCDLIKCVELAAYLLGMYDLCGLRTDIWGDGCEIGGLETTRFAFRVLSEKISCQSSSSVFCFASYRGNDSRFAMEQNLGPTIAGDQSSGWLYQETSELSDRGVKLTDSGDTPFLLRLILGISCETNFKSKMPLHISDNGFLPTNCHLETGLRTDLKIPFREELPKTSLVYFQDVRCICPDPTHMITRCVENDLRRVAQKIITDKYPDYGPSLKDFEENLTRRDAERPYLQFNVNTKLGSGVGTVISVSLAGSNALSIIAEKEELAGANDCSIGNLFEDVWDPKNDVVIGSESAASAQILKQLLPELFDKPHPNDKTCANLYISKTDACELLRSSLNRCAILLRSEQFDAQCYKKWAEIYYQTSILLFGECSLTPYKLKLAMMPQIVEGGFVERPFDHMCEGLEKSNHHANRYFQTKTMRGGGKIYHKDPLFLELSSSFRKFLRASIELKTKKYECLEISEILEILVDDLDAKYPGPTYLEICKTPISSTSLAIGKSHPDSQLLSGMRFTSIGRLGVVDGISLTKDVLNKLINEMGDIFIEHNQADTLMKTHSRLPNCFVLVKDEEDLVIATGSVQEIEDLKKKRQPAKKNRRSKPSLSTSQSSDSDSQYPSSKFTARQKKETAQYSQIAQKFAKGGLTFSKKKFIMDVKKLVTLLDPKDYTIAPGSIFRRARVNDMRPLFRDQISGKNQTRIYRLWLISNDTEMDKPDYQNSFSRMMMTLLPEKLTTLMMMMTTSMKNVLRSPCRLQSSTKNGTP